jgi:uncharacterized protein YjbI with pentapeptide repeats
MEVKKINGIKYENDSRAIDIEDSDITNCTVIGSTHISGYATACNINDCIIRECFIDKFSIEYCTFTNCAFDAVSSSEVEFTRSVFDSCTFQDCSFGTLTMEETVFINCTLNNCSFSNTSFNLSKDSKTKLFSNCKLIKCQIDNCKFMNQILDGRLCEVKGYMASLSNRLFYQTNIHGTKMYHNEVIVENKRRRGRGKGKEKRRMSHFGGDYLHPNLNNRGSGMIPNADKLFESYNPYGCDDVYDEYYNQKSYNKNYKKAFVFCSDEL